MTEEFKNESVTVRVEKQPACKVKYTASASANLVKQEYKEALKAVAKEVSIPGFRKGKAPEAMLKKNFGAKIESQWQKGIADKTFRECEKLTQIPVLTQGMRITFEMKKHAFDEGAEMEFEFESEPQIGKVVTSGLKIDKGAQKSVGEKEVNETIDRIRGFFGHWKDVSDRAAREGDFVRLDVDLIEGETPSRAFSNQRFEIADGKMAKWMRDLVVGMKVGESKEGVSKADDDDSEEEKKKFEPKKVSVILTAIEESDLPNIDDELAKKLGVESLEIMKERLCELLNKQEAENHQRKLREKVSKQLVEKNAFELPSSVLEKEVDYRLKQQQQNPYFANKWKQMTREEQESQLAQIREDAENALRIFYLCRHIIQEEKLTLNPQKLVSSSKTPLDAMFADPRLQDLDNEEQKALAMSRLMLETAQDFVIENLSS